MICRLARCRRRASTQNCPPAASAPPSRRQLRFGGEFNGYVKQRDLTKQEGIIFRHLLRLILLCAEFGELTPADTTEEEWRTWLRDVEARLTAACRKVDPTSTDMMIQSAK